MFNFFKKETIGSYQRFAFAHNKILESSQKIAEATLNDLQYAECGYNNISKEKFPLLISTISTQRLGFGIVALNIGIRKQNNFRELTYSTLGSWEDSIRKEMVTISKFLSTDLQKEICKRFVDIYLNFKNEFYGVTSSFEMIKITNRYFANCFFEEASWYCDYYDLGKNEKFLKYSQNQFLSSFSYFDRFFAKYKHV
jgi:hypothetical protein